MTPVSYTHLDVYKRQGQEHGACAQHAAGICIFGAALLDHTGGGAVNRFKHCISFANVSGTGGAYTTLEFCSFIGNDIAI